MPDHFPRELFRAARVALDKNVREMAELAKISPTTISVVEGTDRHVSTKTIEKIGRALEHAGIEFLPLVEGKGPGFRLLGTRSDESQPID